MAPRPNLEIVEEAYAAVGQGQIPHLIEMMADDVDIQVPGPLEIPFAGSYRGREGAGEFFLALAESAEVLQFQPTEYIAGGKQVVVLGHEQLTARATGRTWDTDWAMVWTIEDGRIAALREFHQTAAIAQAFATGARERGFGRS